MDDKTLNLKFHGRRRINSAKRRTYNIIGTIQLILGLFGLIKSSFEMNMFLMLFIIFAIAGIINIIYGLIGKELIKEKNSISITSKEIEYKNSFKKLKTIKISDLLDLRIETAKVEFVLNGQQVESYDFSVFQRQELDEIYKEFEMIKANLIK